LFKLKRSKNKNFSAGSLVGDLADPLLITLVKRDAEMSIAALPLPRSRVAAGFFKELTRRGSFFFEDIEKVHEFDRILVFTSETS
jgi:hypothetical protein